MLDHAGSMTPFAAAGGVAVDGEQPQLADGTLGCCHGGGGEGPPDAARPHRGRQGSRQRLASALACTEQPAQPGGALDAAAMAAHGSSCPLGLQHNSPWVNTRGPEVSRWLRRERWPQARHQWAGPAWRPDADRARPGAGEGSADCRGSGCADR
jgi:hypothetical protein